MKHYLSFGAGVNSVVHPQPLPLCHPLVWAKPAAAFWWYQQPSRFNQVFAAVPVNELNGQTITVDLIPEGNCTQWLAVFDGKPWKVAGMKAIHAEIRRRMPPMSSGN